MCVKQPCNIIGTKECIKQPGVSRKCICKTGFSGDDCQIDKGFLYSLFVYKKNSELTW